MPVHRRSNHYRKALLLVVIVLWRQLLPWASNGIGWACAVISGRYENVGQADRMHRMEILSREVPMKEDVPEENTVPVPPELLDERAP